MTGQWRRMVGVVLAVGLVGCAGPEDAAIPVATTAAEAKAESLYGNYLAGRVAGAQRETGKAAQFYAEALRQDPKNDVLLDRAFLLALADGQAEAAIKRAEEIVARDPDKRLAQLMLALQSVKGGAYAEARQRLAIESSAPFNALAVRLITAWCLEGEGRTDDALAELMQIEPGPLFDLFRTYHTALINDHAGRAEAAAAAYKKVVAGGAGPTLRYTQAYGNFLARQGQLEDARKVYDAFAETQPDNPIIDAARSQLDRRTPAGAPFIAVPSDGVAEVLYGLASVFAADRSVDLPIIYLELALYVRPDFDIARTLLADRLELVGRYAEANKSYAQIAGSSPLADNAAIQSALNLDRLDKTNEAIRKLKALSSRGGGDLRALVSLGDLLRSRERFVEAVAAYDKAIGLVLEPDARHWSLYYARGVSLERAGRWPEAERDLLRALALDPERPLVLNYLGYSWIEKGERLQEALKMIEHAVELMPSDGYVVDSLGWAHYRLGRYDAAVTYLERAVNLKPDDPTINDHLGDVYWKTGREMEARFQWRRAITLGADKKLVPIIEHKLEYGLESARSATNVSDREP